MKERLKGLALPLLVITYPILFLYGQNAWILNLGILKLPLISSLLLAGLVFGLFYLFQHSALSASLSAVAFVFFFYLYGLVYRTLAKADKFPVEHYTLLPVLVVLAGYAGYFISTIRSAIIAAIQKILLVVSTGLLVLNLLIIVPVEVQKVLPKQSLMPVTTASAAASSSASGAASQKYPNVYYIIFDEYVRFDAMREYWHNTDVDAFEAFLKQNHFFLASQSITPTINTTTEMASRLNLHQYTEKDDPGKLLQLINNSKVMQIFKAHGYTTVSINMAYSDINADYNFKFDTTEVGGLASDEFQQTFLSDTMFSAFSDVFQDSDPVAVKQRDSIMFAFDKTADLGSVPAPRFVYTHFLLPHTPFIFDKNSNLLPPQDAEDWHYYLGQYQYATKLAMQLISRILANADPSNPPVIIVQSDEGARNLQSRTKDNIVVNGYLENYPGRYNQYILNALYLPGYDTSKLPLDLPPIDTFQIVLNHYLNAGVSVDTPPPQ